MARQQATKTTRKRTTTAPKRGSTIRKPWSDLELRELRRLAKANTPTRLMGLKLGRTPAAVYQKAASARISLKPANQSPYGRRS